MAKNKHFPEINMSIVEDTDTYAKVLAEPLERGYGVTLGNCLRRVMLTALPGAAITSVKFDGVTHEFSTIKGVIEDVTDVVLNLKSVRFKMIDSAQEIITVTVQGPGTITGEDINKVSEMFEVLNPETHIATISDNTKISMELRIARGKGYTVAERNIKADNSLGTITIDSIFNPITNVSWNVQDIPASIEGHERLMLEVESDGSTDPKDAINHAASILIQQLSLFLFTDSGAIRAVNEEEINEALEVKNTLLKSIDEMELSVRSHNCLQAAGIRLISELVVKEENEMLRFKNFGRKSLTELVEKLGQMGLHFGMDISMYIDDEE